MHFILGPCHFFQPNMSRQKKKIVTFLTRVFLRWAPITCFPALGAGYSPSFTALSTGYIFSCAWRWLPVFPCLLLVTCFRALRTGYIFSCVWHWLHVLPRLSPVTCVPALDAGYIFPRVWHRLFHKIDPRVLRVKSFIIVSKHVLINYFPTVCQQAGCTPLPKTTNLRFTWPELSLRLEYVYYSWFLFYFRRKCVKSGGCVQMAIACVFNHQVQVKPQNPGLWTLDLFVLNLKGNWKITKGKI